MKVGSKRPNMAKFKITAHQASEVNGERKTQSKNPKEAKGAKLPAKSPSFCLGTQKGLLLLLLAAAILHLSTALDVLAQGGESCHLRELELCLIGFGSFLQNPNGIPLGEAEMKRHCEFMKESCDCYQTYAQRCLTPMQSSMIHFFAEPIVELERDLCGPKSELRAEYLKRGACLRQVQRQIQRKCATDFQVGFERIHKIEHALRLPTACCNINRLENCVFTPIEEECGAESKELVKKLLRRMMSHLVQETCKEYKPESSNCTSLLPAEGTEPQRGRNISGMSRIISSYANVGDPRASQ